MKKDKKRRKPDARAAAVRVSAGESPSWLLPSLLLAAAAAAFVAYSPALGGPFLFDDLYLPFMSPGFAHLPLARLAIGVRPMLMLSYKLNLELSGLQPASYHLLNLALHMTTALLAGLIARRYLDLAGTEESTGQVVAFLLGGLFLLHPLQTESVSYIASRSETLSVFFAYSAWAAFLCRKSERVGFRRAAAVILLYGMAVLTKEHTAVMPAIFILSDLYFRDGSRLASLKRNWRLYAPITAAGLVGMAFIWRILRMSNTVGFRMKDITWYDYFFTQCRAVWAYLRLFVLPFGQNLDPQFPFSHSVLDHGAIFGLLALLVWVGAALYFRNRFPLASFGTFAFLILLAPTSSFMPIADPFAERRVYLPMLGLLLIVGELARRVKASRSQLASTTLAVLLVCTVLTWRRNQVWTSDVALWQDTVEKSPDKARPRSQLAFAYYSAGRCAEAAAEYKKASELAPPDQALYADWALAEDCAGNFQASVDIIRKSIALRPNAHAYATLGMFYAKHGDDDQALAALDLAEQRDAHFFLPYVYRGNIYMRRRQYAKAAEQFRKALDREPFYDQARQGLAAAEAALRSSGNTDR